MYSESDLDGAVDAGVLTRENVTAFRDHMATVRATSLVDEEHFRLLTGFNDIFVSIAILLIFVALGMIGGKAGPALIAAASWGLAEFFTRQRRMALPSILLLLSFVSGVAITVGLLTIGQRDPASDVERVIVALAVAIGSVAAAWLHWRRFMVPITVAAGAAALAITMILLAINLSSNATLVLWPVMLLSGLAVFALAMWWDISDRERRTRRSDVAFWLHLTAAPMIAHPIFQMLGVFHGSVGPGMAIFVLLLYVAFGIVALAVDRRALLVSSLAYVLSALYTLFEQFGAVGMNTAATALVIGSALLTLSAFWHPIRRAVLSRLDPALADRLPPVAA